MGRGKKNFLLLLIFISIIIFLRLIIPFLLIKVGEILVYNEIPLYSDVIIVLSGEDEGQRARYAFNLYQRGLSKRILLSGRRNLQEETGIDLMERYLVKLGVPKQNIILERYSESTVENAFFSKKLMEENGFKSAIVVTSPFHTRRVSIIFKKTFSPKLKVLVCSDPDVLNIKKWWHNPRDRRIVVRECFQIVWYLIFRD